MRILFVIPALASAGAILLPASLACAQASLDTRALDQLKPRAEQTQPPQSSRPGGGNNTRKQPSLFAPPPPAPPPAAAPPAAPQVRVPLAPPPAPDPPPALAVPVRPAPAPPPPAIAADAPGSADPIADGLRITFGAGRADLNPSTDKALLALAQQAAPDSRFAVSAYAPGTPEDPSTPRRLSLSRALTVRSVLIAEGIPSERIYVKALGAGAGIAAGPADRVDVTVIATNSQARSSR